MEPNDIITESEEVIETAAEEVAASASPRILRYVATFSLGAIVGIIAYEYAVKPIWARCKEQRDRRNPVVTVVPTPVEQDTDEEESDEET